MSLENSKMMNEELAEFVARVAFKSASELSKLLPILKEQLSDEEYKKISEPIIKITQAISMDLVLDIFDNYPNVDKRIKFILENYGKLP